MSPNPQAIEIVRGVKKPRASCASTSRVVGQAKRFAREIADDVKRASDVTGQLALEGLPSNSTRWRRGSNR
jgi:hypothetical protein